MKTQAEKSSILTTDAAASSALSLDPNATSIPGIRVFDVGQGDCIGLLDQNNAVICYIDYGGLGDHPDAFNTNNTKLRLAVAPSGARVPIVLTHWDKDHYYSAVNKNTEAQECDWLVPRQHASPQAVIFAAKLNRARCWPEAIGQRVERFPVGANDVVEIRKCKPYVRHTATEDRNRSGLAITVIRTSNGTDHQTMILPGDCHFDGIPGIPPVPIRAIIAYHHGSHVHWTSATATAIGSSSAPCRMVYSYGRNSFGHPDTSSYAPHWDASAAHTPTVRALGNEHIDIAW